MVSDLAILTMREMRANGETFQTIGDRFGISRQRVHQLLTGRGGNNPGRFLMAQILDRPLESREVVHHVNGNHTDNRPENLALFPNQKAHEACHLRQRWLDAALRGIKMAPGEKLPAGLGCGG